VSDLAAAVAAALGARPLGVIPLSGGCIGELRLLDMPDGGRLVAKRSPNGGLALEAWMLDYLARHSELPLPRVLHADDRLLVMDYVEAGDPLDAAAETHAAELLAALHGVTAPRFGLERDTLIGSLPQPNAWTDDWRDFFAEQRLLYMGRLAAERGRLPTATLARLERLAGRLDRYLEAPPAASLLHGDLWGGNVLVRGGRIAALIDPAVYYGDPEIELAFATLFGTFGAPFFRRYDELRGLAPGFFELRCDLYNLYPLLVHSALFGGSYPGAVARIVERLT
jgi:fructosamine-3-kinase